MVRLWFKIMNGDKIVKSFVLNREEEFTYSSFREYIQDGCYSLDLSTPIIIKKTLYDFARYNRTVFKASDFIEKINFDKLVVENIDEK